MKVILTGVKPSGIPHIGNYLGAIKPALDARQNNSQNFFFIADYHALTTVHDKKLLEQYTREIACVWLACGLDPKTTIFYRQSDVPEVFELFTILNNVTPKGLMDRAHAYKAAKQDGREVNMGLYNYPILMAADILLYNTNYVPVGADQQQHVEIAADIAAAFNAVYGKILTIPEPLIQKEVAVIPGLDGRKMSKSYGNVIPLFCSSDELLKCIKKITTDSTAPDAPKDPNHLICQLLKLFGGGNIDMKQGWGILKQKLFETLDNYLKPMREKYNYLISHFDEVENILADGAKKARETAKETLSRVREAIGAGRK
jgi:tryptophanyl-tRNA synthetase